MVIFLYGPDTYRSRQKLNEIIVRYKDIHKSGLSFSDFGAQDNDFDDFRRAADTVSMFGEKKLIVLRNFVTLRGISRRKDLPKGGRETSSKEFIERFLLWEKIDAINDSRDVVCVFVDEAVDKKNSLFVWLDKNSQCQEFNILTGAHLYKWAKRSVAEKGISMEDAALYRFIAHTGGDLWSFESGLKKLKSYAGSKITQEDLNIFLQPTLQSHIFSFTDAIAEGDRPKAFKFLRGHLEAGDSGNYIFSMTHHQFRNIALAQDFFEKGEYNISKIAQQARIHPFVAKKSLYFAKRLGKDNIKKIYRKLIDLDRDIKTGKLNASEALETLILSP